MEPIYIGDKSVVARVGDVVMVPGNMRGIVIAVNGIFVTVLGIGTNKNTGDTYVLTPRFTQDYPVSECFYMERQMLNL